MVIAVDDWFAEVGPTAIGSPETDVPYLGKGGSFWRV